tara:strand:+ start:1313 stop:1483 length:171 start_codon:yes stop_codon:yes gene_type:complete
MYTVPQQKHFMPDLSNGYDLCHQICLTDLKLQKMIQVHKDKEIICSAIKAMLSNYT